MMSSVYAEEVYMECTIIMYQLSGRNDLEKLKKNGRMNWLANSAIWGKSFFFSISLSVRSGEIFPRCPATQKEYIFLSISWPVFQLLKVSDPLLKREYTVGANHKPLYGLIPAWPWRTYEEMVLKICFVLRGTNTGVARKKMAKGSSSMDIAAPVFSGQYYKQVR